jgi:nucleoside-diphosphate-sugar epimerase
VKVLVTGGGGFLGKRIVELLLEQGHDVHSFARGAYPEVEALGATCHRGDLQDPDAVRAATVGMDAVVHTASVAGAWGERSWFEGINLRGTEHVIAACQAESVRKLVYTSTPSVIGYGSDVEGIAEAPYPDAWESLYGETKAKAEQQVRAAHGTALADGGVLLTTSLRPHLIVGPGDNHLLPRVVDRAKKGQLRIVGDGTNKVDLTYVDNAAWAHLDALEALSGVDAPCGGQAYFISNDEPVVLWDWTNDVLEAIGVPRLTSKVSLGMATFAGSVMETVWRLFRLEGEPRMTRFLALALAQSHWYDMGPAKRDLGYTVRVPMDEGTARTVDWARRELV